MRMDDAGGIAGLLDRQFDALIRGDLAGLEESGHGLAAAITRIDASPSQAEIGAIQERAARNAACLAAALRGVRAARRRLEEIAAAGKGLDTYDAFGRRTAEGMGPDRLRQRF